MIAVEQIQERILAALEQDTGAGGRSAFCIDRPIHVLVSIYEWSSCDLKVSVYNGLGEKTQELWFDTSADISDFAAWAAQHQYLNWQPGDGFAKGEA